jgi:S-adenosylmethionine decarboxylase
VTRPWSVAVVKPLPRLRLQGFNNLTKALSFNIYDICYAVSEDQRQRYIEYIDEQYDADRLTQILTDVAEIIGANILNVARQDYDPQGASVTILISEEPVVEKLGRDTISDAVVAHMDKSHITVHTYPETHPHNGIATFRADIDVATCGVISPLKALNYLIDSFESDIVVCDYRARFHARREGQEALHRSQDQLGAGLSGAPHPSEIRDVRRERVSGKYFPHQDAH